MGAGLGAESLLGLPRRMRSLGIQSVGGSVKALHQADESWVTVLLPAEAAHE